MKIWSKAPDGCFIPRQTGRLIVGRNMTLTLRREYRIGGISIVRRATTQRLTKAKHTGRLRVCFICCEKTVCMFFIVTISICTGAKCVIVSSNMDKPTYEFTIWIPKFWHPSPRKETFLEKPTDAHWLTKQPTSLRISKVHYHVCCFQGSCRCPATTPSPHLKSNPLSAVS
jgi:hypothetical protein